MRAFTSLLRAEWLKLRTTRVTWVFLGGAVALASFLVLAALAAPEINGRVPHDVPHAVRVVFSATSASAPLLAVLGALLVSGEYRHGTITPTFLAQPRRGRVMSGKLLVAVVTGAVIAVVAVLVTAALAFPALHDVKIRVDLGDGFVREPLVGALVGLPLWCALGVAVGACLRNQVGAVVSILAWTTVAEPTARAIVPHAARYFPATAGQALAGSAGHGLLSPLAGGLVFAAYVAVLAVVAMQLVVRRDVT